MLNLFQITKKLHPAKFRRVRLFAALLCVGCAFNAQAALHCNVGVPWLNMFSGNSGHFFAFPDDIASLPIGARVGGLREVNLRYNCLGMLPAEKFGTGMQGVSGLTYHAATQTYTNPQLEALGLGFRIWWHEPNGHETHNVDAHPNSNPTIDYPPVNWYSRPRAAPRLDISTRIIFFKINNNFANTNGANINATVNVELFRFYIAEQSAPTTPRGAVQPFVLNLKKFASMKRVCTPLVDTTVNFGSMSGSEMSSIGVVESSTQTFSLNFNCPYMAYYMVGFKLEGVYGVLDATNGVFGIKQGPGYASGVGVQFSAENLATSWRDNQSYTSGWQVLKPNQNYSIPWFEYSSADSNVNPATSDRNKTVNFRAKYYRMPGVLVGGAVESRVLVRLVYQ